MNSKNYYAILDIDSSASATEIQSQFRKLARKYHPDLNKEKQAELKFKEVNESYEVLSNPDKKRKYDSYIQSQSLRSKIRVDSGSIMRKPGFSNFFDGLFSDMSNSVLFRAKKMFNSDVAINGESIETIINLNPLEAKGGISKDFTFEFIDTDSEGNQKRNTKTYKVKIPEYVQQGSVIRLSGQGTPGANGGKVGDLLLRVNIS